jgi:hypothetical protein
MSIPRNWTPLAYQRSEDQTLDRAKPQATDGRFKAGAFFLFLAWLVILFSLRHSIHHYKPRNRGILNSIIGGIRYTPLRFLLTIPLSLVIVGYQIAISFDFSISPLNQHGDVRYIYGLGWAPIVLIFIVQEVAGYILPNEDRELIRQRRIRGAEIDAEMGYTKKPHWWSRLNGYHNLTVQQALARQNREVTGRDVAGQGDGEGTMELKNLPKRNVDKNVPVDLTPALRASARRESRMMQQLKDEKLLQAAKALFPSGAPEPPKTNAAYLMSDEIMDAAERGRTQVPGGGPSSSVRSGATQMTERSNSQGSVATTGTVNAPPQQVRSMLDL